ncbi:MAG: hypothetical protein KGH65_00150 [Candidatus Micrarchaeota archaeon]|nr:hypothetical protein [Candidatus Micrarchaeota archaeon]
MACFDSVMYDNLLIYNNIIGFHDSPIQLNSKRFSIYYFNGRRIYDNTVLTELIAGHVVNFMDDMHIAPKTICGIPVGMMLFGGLVQRAFVQTKPQEAQKEYSYVTIRPTPKDHGAPADKNFIGKLNSPIVLIEDVTTTALSILKTINRLKKLGFRVEWVVSLMNRMEKTPIQNLDDEKIFQEYKKEYMEATGSLYSKGIEAKEAVEMTGARYFSLTDAQRILPKAAEIMNLRREKIEQLLEERKEWGTERKPLLSRIKN